MGKPSIGEAETPVIEKRKKREVKKLTVLEENSKESIYYLLFSEAERDGLNLNGK